MKETIKTIDEINERIHSGSAMVLTADEMSLFIEEFGVEKAVKDVDVVTTGTFGAMCSSGVFLNFGHADIPIKFRKVWLNEVEAYSGIAAVDIYLGATQPSENRGIYYGGGHVIEDLVCGKRIFLEVHSPGTDCYLNKKIETEITINDLNQAIMCNPRNGYERYNAAINSSEKVLYTYMGKLLPDYGNITFSGAGELSPIINDPQFQTIGIGTKIFLGGGEGYIIGSGTQHNPENGFATLMVKGDLKTMSPDFIHGATFTGYGSSLYLGLGIPIPIINASIARAAGITDKEIETKILDYSFPLRNKPIVREVNYEELKSNFIEINGKEVRTSSLSSFFGAKRIANLLKENIQKGKFFLTKAVESLSKKGLANPMKQIETSKQTLLNKKKENNLGELFVHHDKKRCINCGLCLGYCIAGVFTKQYNCEIHAEPHKCINCRQCEDICPQNAIQLKEKG